ncbi:MAG: DUF1592 domain-containing protein [Planctomycetes bacterium]|nr:DUF1592 domain-containing protein [Planctomycetota bacterium]
MWLLLLPDPQAADFAASVAPLLAEHCVECHSGARPKGDLDLAVLVEEASAGRLAERRESLTRMRELLLADEMPPPKKPRPPAALVASALTWLERELGPTAPKPRLRRLNRVEFEHAVRDLFGVSYPAREFFPADDVGARYDTDAAGAAASELLVERWIEAAERVAARALALEGECETRRWSFDELEIEGGGARQGTNVALYSRGRVYVTQPLACASRYRLELSGWGDMAGDELPQLAFELDGERVGLRELSVAAGARETLAVTFAAEAGTHDLGATFLNDYYAAEAPDPTPRDRNVHVVDLALVGPLDPPPATAFTRFVDAQLERGTLADALAALGLRVWRRPLVAHELARLAALSADDAPPRARVRTALVALLASPHFLYKVEQAEPSAARRAFELATRLSFFLWASVPDAELLQHAARGDLAEPALLKREVRRLLRDARSRSLVEEFGAQWLGWRALTRATPDRRAFPEADAALLDSMRQESEAFFEAMLREERPLAEFLSADFTFVDERLAHLYGIEGVEGAGVRRVPLADGVRGGLLGQAALLTVTSNPTRTAPVKRGKWILETLLGTHVRPPPPGVGVLVEAGAGQPAPSLREQLALHRAKPECASCHDELDPLGFALEGFDAIGAARRQQGEHTLDERGQLADGTVLEGVAGLKRYLLQSGRFPRALARALFGYALGREPSPADERELGGALDGLAAERRTLAGVVELVCLHSAFRGETQR